jgi:putative acetyltransferase
MSELLPAEDLVVREENPDDIEAIRRINRLAFERDVEAGIVDALREAGAVTLSMVACQVDPATGAEEVIGHALYSPIIIEGANESCSAVGLGPLAVLPDYQRQGVGTFLMEVSLEILRRAGHPAVILVGHPNYYPRFGFLPAEEWGLSVAFEVPPGVFQAIELQPGALAGVAGTIRFRPEFVV